MKKRTLWIIIAVVVVLAAGCAGALSAGGGKSNSQGVTTKDNPINAATSAAATQAAVVSNPNSITGDGTFAVGSQVKPGTYRAVVPADSVDCYYERLKDASGSFDSIIDNNTGRAGSQQIVDIQATDRYFHTEGCGTWTKVG